MKKCILILSLVFGFSTTAMATSNLLELHGIKAVTIVSGGVSKVDYPHYLDDAAKQAAEDGNAYFAVVKVKRAYTQVYGSGEMSAKTPVLGTDGSEENVEISFAFAPNNPLHEHCFNMVSQMATVGKNAVLKDGGNGLTCRATTENL